MIQPFGLRNSLRLQSLARRSTPLSLEHRFADPLAVVWAAVGAPLPWHGTGAATYLHVPNSTHPVHGFVQAVKRFARPEADLTRIAPAYHAHPQAGAIWQALLEHVSLQAGEHGIQRLYLCLESEDEAQTAVTAVGFVPYIQETLFRHPGVELKDQAEDEAAWPHVRGQRETDSIALQRLHSRYTPPLVQQAEGSLLNHDETPSPLDLRTWWQPERIEGFVYETKGEIVAAAQLTRGRHAHWLRLIGDLDATALTALLRRALHACSRYSKRPLYVPLRPYQSGFGPILRDFGFEPTTTLTRFVRHTTALVKKPLPLPVKEAIEVTLTGIVPYETPHARFQLADEQPADHPRLFGDTMTESTFRHDRFFHASKDYRRFGRAAGRPPSSHCYPAA